MTRGVSARSSILNYTTPVQVAAPALGGKGGARRDIACRRSSRRRRGRTVAGRLRIAYCVQCYAPASGEGRGEQSWQVEDAVCSGWQKWRGLKRMDVAAIAWLTLASALKSASMALCCLREVSSVERCCAISSPRSFIDMATSCLCQARESAQLSPRSRAAKFRSTLEYRNHDPEYPVSAATAARTAVAAARQMQQCCSLAMTMDAEAPVRARRVRHVVLFLLVALAGTAGMPAGARTCRDH